MCVAGGMTSTSKLAAEEKVPEGRLPEVSCSVRQLLEKTKSISKPTGYIISYVAA